MNNIKFTLLISCLHVLHFSSSLTHSIQKRYTHGENADYKDWSETVLIKKGSGDWNICTGSLLNANYVLTAGHCVTPHLNIKKEDIRVYIGLQNRSAHEDNMLMRRVEELKIYPKYEAQNHSYDIALIKLHSPVRLNGKYSFITPVCLKLKSPRISQRTQCVGLGWGRMNGYRMPQVLQKLEMKVSSLSACAKLHEQFYSSPPSFERVIDTHVCMVSKTNPHPEGGSSYGAACAGDSGGPLMCVLHKKWYQVGIAWSNTDCVQNPSVYNRIDKYSDWIVKESNYIHPSYC